jgi:hypothetical protein
MDLVLYTLAEEELRKAESLIENNIPKIEALFPEYIKIYNELCNKKSLVAKKNNVDLKSMYRAASFKAHPDKGGDAEAFKKLSSAYRNGDKREFMNVYNTIMGNHTQVLGELIGTNGYKWALMYEKGQIEEVKKSFLKYLLNEIYMLEVK